MANKLKKQFLNYCKENWALPEYETERALDIMDKFRCPLSQASERVAEHILDLADDFTMENDDLPEDWFYETFEDEEEVFWKLG